MASTNFCIAYSPLCLTLSLYHLTLRYEITEIDCTFSTGGTVDITVHEIEQNGYLHELERASGGDWGGTSVDNAFKNTLAEIVTEEVLASYSYKHPSDYIELFMSFETVKRRCERGRQDLNSFLTLNIPNTFFHECLETLTTDLNTLINKSKFKGHFILKSNKLRISLISFKRFFLPACDGTINHIKKLFQSPKVKDVNKILMVGGFSESYILQEAIRNAFPDCQVIVPIEAGVAVLRGAVLFGFSPNTVNSRIAKHTYGVDMNAIFNPKIHKESKKEVIEGVEYCTGIFDRHVGMGEAVSINAEHGSRYYIPITQKQKVVSFGIYVSFDKNPLYIEHCKPIGKVVVNLPVGSKDCVLDVRMVYGNTDLTVKAFVSKTGEQVAACVDLLD